MSEAYDIMVEAHAPTSLWQGARAPVTRKGSLACRSGLPAVGQSAGRVAHNHATVIKKMENYLYCVRGRQSAFIIVHIRLVFNRFFLFPADFFGRKGVFMSKLKKSVFTGAASALVTPFRDGGIDYAATGALIDWQIAEGIDALVIAGTTGEGSTLSHEEHCALLRFAVEKVAGRVPVIAGTGSNDTAYGIELSRYACDVGCDALLLVTPYYNKCTPLGLTRSFLAIADATNKPIILYNVPSRTGVNIPLSVYREVSKHERIVATKEASGNISAIAEVLSECGDALDVYSGNDDQIVPILSLGGKGVISVLSDVMPRETHELCRACLKGDFATGAAMQLRLLRLIGALFSEVNPIPVKTALALMGRCGGELRLPLCEMEPAHEKALAAVLKEYGLLA